MRGVNDRKFLNLWQILYRATCPNPTATQWRVGDVDWRKERLSFSGVDCAVTIEVHHLLCATGDRAEWALMVAVEHWWDGGGEPLKATSWARPITGNPKTIISWLQRQEKVRAALGE